jgi:xanthine dehydrogenase accessory factor
VNDWLKKLDTQLGDGQDCVLITVAYTAGSAPREAGTKMLVTSDNIYGTIGGGNLEHNAIQTARSYLIDSALAKKSTFLDLYALGPMLEQCCGGVVFLHYELVNRHNCDWVKVLTELNTNSLKAIIVTRTGKQNSEQDIAGKLIVTEFETTGSIGESELDNFAITRARELLQEAGSSALLHPLTETAGKLPNIGDALLFDVIWPGDFHIALFGAGHVGKAIVSVLLNSSSSSITWVDSREGVFPEELPSQVSTRHVVMPTNTVEEIPPDSFYLVMTHSHQLDLALCEAILKRIDFRFLGLIGSETKRKRFCKQLRERGIPDIQLERLSCPIGISGIESKEPGSIAISVVAQLMQLYEKNKNKQAGSVIDNNICSI